MLKKQFDNDNEKDWEKKNQWHSASNLHSIYSGDILKRMHILGIYILHRFLSFQFIKTEQRLLNKVDPHCCPSLIEAHAC